MGRSKKEKATFFSEKSKVQNASILHELRSYCSHKCFRLVGVRLFGSLSTDLEFVDDSSPDRILNFIQSSIVTMAPGVLKDNRIIRYTEAYAWARRFAALSSKNLSIPLGVDTRQAAFDKFLETERTCKEFNRDFANLFNTTTALCGQSSRSVIDLIRRKIQYYLGEVPRLDELHCAFGPGSNSTCRKKTSAKWKLSSRLAIAEDGIYALNELRTLYPRLNWASLDLSDPEARYGVLSSVSKKATIDRMINIEPILNTFVQRPIGSIMKRRLLQVGCNLYDQSVNRERARLASLNDGDATVDMVSASNLIAFMCPNLLLSNDWFEFLATWRTDKVIFSDNDSKEVVIPLEMFSSMGNGYTFELESCIFFACAQVANELTGSKDPSRVSVYGDDIICPQVAIPFLKEIFNFLKFEMNDEKSFVSGCFRESCGGDYLLGVNVRPFFVKDSISDARLVAMSNQVARSGFPDTDYRAKIESYISLKFKKYGPDGYGDGHLIDYPERTTYSPSHRKDGWAGSTFETIVKVAKSDNARPYYQTSVKTDLETGWGILPFYVIYMKDSYFNELEPEDPGDPTTLAASYAKRLVEYGNFSTKVYRRGRVREILEGVKGISRETDPHVLRGGDTARVIRVYLLNPSLP